MQGLDTSIQHFRKSRVIGDFGYGDTVFLKQFRCSASRKNGDIHGGQFSGEFDNACFVRDGYQSELSHGNRVSINKK